MVISSYPLLHINGIQHASNGNENNTANNTEIQHSSENKQVERTEEAAEGDTEEDDDGIERCTSRGE